MSVNVNYKGNLLTTISNGSTKTLNTSGKYMEDNVQIVDTVTNGSAFPPAVTITKAPTFSMNSSTGVITASYTGSSSITPTVNAGYISQGTAGTISTTGSSTYTLTTQGAQTITPGSTAQTIASNRWLTGTQTIAGDSNLKAENIAEGVSIFGVTGTHSEGVPVDDIALRTISVSGGIRGNASMISNYAFYGCYSIYSVSFPNATKIGSGAFAHCNHLREMYFPAVTQIMAEAFTGCVSLRTISFSLVSSVGKSAFATCKNLTEVNLPEALVIADYAFVKCSYLNTVRLPKVSLISYLAFSGCSRLTSVYLNEVSQVPSTDYHDPFEGTKLSSSGQIYVPASLYQDFIVATYWSKYSAQMISV